LVNPNKMCGRMCENPGRVGSVGFAAGVGRGGRGGKRRGAVAKKKCCAVSAAIRQPGTRQAVV